MLLCLGLDTYVKCGQVMVSVGIGSSNFLPLLKLNSLSQLCIK